MGTYSQRDLEDSVNMCMRFVMLNKVIYAYPTIPRVTIKDRAKRTRQNKKIQKPGTQTVLTEEVEKDLKIDLCHAKMSFLCDKGYGINKGESNIFRGLWDKNKEQARVRSQMTT